MTEGLHAGHLTGNSRNEFIRDVCSAIRMHTLNPTKHQHSHVALIIVKTYPFLAEKTWEWNSKYNKNINYYLYSYVQYCLEPNEKLG